MDTYYVLQIEGPKFSFWPRELEAPRVAGTIKAIA